MKADSSGSRKWVGMIFGIFACVGLYLSSKYNYLLFHSLSELFSIIVACGIFIVAWNSRKFLKNNYLLFLGIAYFFIALLDLLHTLSYTGMGVFPEYGANLPTQLWIGARYMESLSLIMATMFFSRPLKANILFFSYSIIFTMVLLFFFGGIFPACFVEGAGLTSFKIISEYIISLFLLGAVARLYQHRGEFDPGILKLLIASILTTIVGELVFTFYISVYGFSNLIGHFMKIISFFLIYKALIYSGLTKPYDLLFRNLKKSEEAYRSILKTAMDGFWITDSNANLLEVNDTYCKMSGYSKKELLKMQISDLEAVESSDDIDTRIQAIIEKGEARFQTIHRRKDGTLFDVEISVQYRDNDGAEFICFLHDITERLKTENALKKNQRRYEKAQQIGKVGNWEYDLVTEKFWGSDEAKRIYCLSPDSDDFTTDQVENCILERERVHQALLDLIEKDKPYNLEFEIQPVTGLDKRFIASKAEVLKDDSGTPKKVAGVIRDITERKQIENRLQQAQKMEAIGTLSGGIAHDFNNILFPIVGHTEMLLEDIPKESPFQENLSEIYTGALRARDLVKQILTFSRQEKTQLKLIKMQSVIKEALKLVRSTVPATIEIQQDIQKDCRFIKADPTQIHQIVMNLTTNAFQAMEEDGGQLNVSLKEVVLGELDLIFPNMETGTYACLIVSDTGTGITKELTDKVFDPFFTTKEKGKGTGMGLSVVHGIVKGLKGAVQVYSKIGEGTDFHVYLPVVEQAAGSHIQLEKDMQSGNERILLVDDESAIINIEKQMLERLGYKVISRTSSVEALEAFKNDPGYFDLVITDFAMPQMPGDKLASEILKIEPKARIILCTGFSEKMTETSAKQIGIDGILLKPIVMQDLAKKIRDVMDEANKKSLETVSS